MPTGFFGSFKSTKYMCRGFSFSAVSDLNKRTFFSQW